MSFIKYEKVKRGVFLERPNRFIAKVEINGSIETVHVKNTGRCRELLIEGAMVYLSESDNPLRKTKYDLICVEKQTGNGNILINMDSQIPNDVAGEWLKKGKLFSENAVIKREVKFGNSRFDFYIEDGKRKAFLEVKGVTLENNGVAMFPDAPTQRGVKHIRELVSCLEEGYESYILFIIQMKGVDVFKPNYITDPDFSKALKAASASGVKIIALDSIVASDSIVADEYIKIVLD